MQLTKILTLVALAGSSVHAQLTNSTLLGILNTTQLSPATKFVELLTSNPKFTPILNLLEQPGNHTLFVPSDKVFARYGIKNNNTNSVISSSQDDNGDEGNANIAVHAAELLRILQQGGSAANQTQGAGQASNLTKPFETDQLSGFNVSDVLLYHLIPGYHTLDGLNQSTVFHTLVTNSTLDKTGQGLAIAVNSNATATNGNATNGEQNNNETVAYWVGNGVSFANVTVHDILASNGVLHVVDDVLVPPGAPSQVLSNISDASVLSDQLNQNQTLAALANNATNVTVFIPTNEALQAAHGKTEPNKNLVLGHIVNNVYYADNLTDLATTNQGIPTLANTTLHFSKGNGTTVRINNQANIIRSNILTDNGVMYLIDKVVEPNGQQSASATHSQSGTHATSPAPSHSNA